MTQPTERTAIYSGLMWPEWNPRSESHGTSQKQANQLLDAYRAAILREAADEAERENADCPVTAAGRPCPPCAARAAVATKLRRIGDAR
ncbi:hypothetical protein MIU24_32475 [Streptomyces venezuelae]|uniref:hypothetical protein n=1 Tax=Streptomyces sp. B6(2022) TaxID=3404749 RepID=UPI00311FA72E